jgi:hypothetical protein
MQNDGDEHGDDEFSDCGDRIGRCSALKDDKARDPSFRSPICGQEDSGHTRSKDRPKDNWTRSTCQPILDTMAREYVWLWDLTHGSSIRAIAAREKLGIRRVQLGVARARARESRALTLGSGVVRPPRLVPLFPVGSYTPQSPCAHKRPIRRGSALCCMVCHRSGLDGHPALRRDPRTDPIPERRLGANPAPLKLHKESRRHRRKRLFRENS